MLNFDYVVISGYIAILFGRSRNTEDVDMFVDVKNRGIFYEFYENIIKNNYYIINAENKEDAYDFLNEGIALRIAEKGEFIPNFKIKLPKREIDRISFANKIKVRFGGVELNTSELELQIAYKLFLGSEKDYLDAKHLYGVYEKYLCTIKFKSYIKLLGVKAKIVKTVLGINIG